MYLFYNKEKSISQASLLKKYEPQNTLQLQEKSSMNEGKAGVSRS